MPCMSAKGDLHTILRHLVSNTQWGGNQGEKAETMEALDRLTDDNQEDDARTADDVNDAKPVPTKTTGARKTP